MSTKNKASYNQPIKNYLAKISSTELINNLIQIKR